MGSIETYSVSISVLVGFKETKTNEKLLVQVLLRLECLNVVVWLLTGTPDKRYWQNRETANIGIGYKQEVVGKIPLLSLFKPNLYEMCILWSIHLSPSFRNDGKKSQVWRSTIKPPEYFTIYYSQGSCTRRLKSLKSPLTFWRCTVRKGDNGYLDTTMHNLDQNQNKIESCDTKETLIFNKGINVWWRGFQLVV